MTVQSVRRSLGPCLRGRSYWWLIGGESMLMTWQCTAWGEEIIPLSTCRAFIKGSLFVYVSFPPRLARHRTGAWHERCVDCHSLFISGWIARPTVNPLSVQPPFEVDPCSAARTTISVVEASWGESPPHPPSAASAPLSFLSGVLNRNHPSFAPLLPQIYFTVLVL